MLSLLLLPALPIGKYTSSCVFCTAENHHVKCGCCFRSDGGCEIAVLEVDDTCGDVENVNGELVCSHVFQYGKKLLSETQHVHSQGLKQMNRIP